MRNIGYLAVRHQGMGTNDEIFNWTGTRNAPVAMFNDDKPRHSWIDILYLANRLGSGASLLPEDRKTQVECIGLSHAICGEDGLGWNRRLDLFHRQVQAVGGNPDLTILPKRMFKDFNGTAEAMAAASDRVVRILEMFQDRLADQQRAGSRYLVGDSLTAADIHLATFLGMLSPLPVDVNPMPERIRGLYESGEPRLRDAVAPGLLTHRDFIYARYLKLPMDF
ncbi:glutathione binding-like protein [Sphingobium sp. AP50]|uniref:glutathione binding-like protein n=1 Tax=Sphingobium sp. AP50 TaxID=1884369 RepID=UPI0011605297|nr:glutathione binding-like protein [Sphingobium sp. AP50]